MKEKNTKNNGFKNYMQIAIEVAKKQNKNLPKEKQEIPVGCVIVDNTTNKIIAKSCNKTISKNNSIMHAEIICINKAIKKLSQDRLTNCSIYITLEPCCMCSGAICLSKISKVYIGCLSKKTGCAINNYCHFKNKISNHKPEIFYPIMEKQCKKLITDFFKDFDK